MIDDCDTFSTERPAPPGRRGRTGNVEGCITEYRTIDSPVGPLTLAGRDGLLRHLRMVDQTHPPPGRESWRHAPGSFALVAEQLAAYFAGQLTSFEVPLHLDGTPFQRTVWNALRDIPYGETVSYGELAVAIGRPGAARAVGLANGRNPIGIIVPCHRVVGANGSLVGYGGGLPRKRALLELEQAQLLRVGASPLTAPRSPRMSPSRQPGR